MKKIFFAIICCLNSITLFSQGEERRVQNSQDIYVYKTYDDFFSNKKTYIGKSKDQMFADTEWACTDTTNNRKFKLRLRDSSNVKGFSWKHENEKFMFGTFHHFICGNSKLFVIFTGSMSNQIYDEKGEFLSGSLYVQELEGFRFVKNMDFINKSKYFEDVIKDKPEIYKQYITEKKADKKAFMRHQIENYKKYIKLYCEN